MRKKIISWTVSPHAKQRAWERYGVLFSPQKWEDFCSTMKKEKYACRLKTDGSGSYRYACFFQRRWFLIGCRYQDSMGVITTFLPFDTLTESDKNMLYAEESLYRTEESWNQNFRKRSVSASKKKLSGIQISDEELPYDFDQIVPLLEKIIK